MEDVGLVSCVVLANRTRRVHSSDKGHTHPTTTSSLANVPVQNRIHDRMRTDSDAFDAQLLSAKTVKGLLSDMTRSVNSLNHAVFDPKVNCS